MYNICVISLCWFQSKINLLRYGRLFFVIRNIDYIFSVKFSGQAIPPATSRHFHPKKKDLRGHIYNAATNLSLSKLDQENLALKIEEWKIEYSDDEIFFRGNGELAEDETRTVEVDQEAEDEEIKV